MASSMVEEFKPRQAGPDEGAGDAKEDDKEEEEGKISEPSFL
jgi:hypothetical protein